MLILQPCAGEQLTKRMVAVLVFTQEKQTMGIVPIVVIGAEDRFNSRTGSRLVENHVSEHCREVRNRKRLHTGGDRFMHNLFRFDQTVFDRKFGVHAKVDKILTHIVRFRRKGRLEFGKF